MRTIKLLVVAATLAGCHREPVEIVGAPQPGTAPSAQAAPLPPGHPAVATAPGNTGEPRQPPVQPGATMPPGHPDIGGAQAEPAADHEGVSGKVVETMSSGGYTYAKLARGTTQVWVAGPETKLAVGAEVGEVSGMVMTAFHSSTLDRTFDQIYFVGSWPVAGAAAANPHAGAPLAAQPVDKLAPAAGGKTIAEVFAGKAALAGKAVVVRGKVVKVNDGILGHNWLHLQDGTGGAGTNDLVVTTDATVAKGDVVVMRGTVATDKDFGAGYSYTVMLENATIAAK